MSPMERNWKARRAPLFRGDSRDSPNVPTPCANDSIVRHILYLDGAGRESPYLSLTEDETVAERFAGRDGKIYKTSVSVLNDHEVAHIARRDLLQLLKGRGKGRAEWASAFEVLQARRYVEENAEHLADFSHQHELPRDEIRALVAKALQ